MINRVVSAWRQWCVYSCLSYFSQSFQHDVCLWDSFGRMRMKGAFEELLTSARLRRRKLLTKRARRYLTPFHPWEYWSSWHGIHCKSLKIKSSFRNTDHTRVSCNSWNDMFHIGEEQIMFSVNITVNSAAAKSSSRWLVGELEEYCSENASKRGRKWGNR